MNQKDVTQMTDDEITSKAMDILRVCTIVENVIKTQNHNIGNPAKAGMVTKILMGDCS